jgi:hypothetical protein
LSAGAATQDDPGGVVNARFSQWNQMFSFRYAYWVREHISVGMQVSSVGLEIETNVGTEVRSQVLALGSVMLEARRYLASKPPRSAVRPYLSGAVGAYIGDSDETTVGTTVIVESGSQGAFAGQVGGGIDVPLGRHVLVGAKAAYNLVSDFERPIGGRSNFSGFEMSVGINWIFGKGFYTRS